MQVGEELGHAGGVLGLLRNGKLHQGGGAKERHGAEEWKWGEERSLGEGRRVREREENFGANFPKAASTRSEEAGQGWLIDKDLPSRPLTLIPRYHVHVLAP
jgi:hypothetical protein